MHGEVAGRVENDPRARKVTARCTEGGGWVNEDSVSVEDRQTHTEKAARQPRQAGGKVREASDQLATVLVHVRRPAVCTQAIDRSRGLIKACFENSACE